MLNGDIRGMVHFKVWNLLEEMFPLGRFDVVLCRNVLVYFDLQSKLYVLQKLAHLLADDGVFYLGRDESVSGLTYAFRPIAPELSIYAAHKIDRGPGPNLGV